jgi:cobalt-zinc-cadmium efflux system outer membrane protein
MRTITWQFVTVVLLVTSAAAVSAQETAPSLSLDDLVSMAFENHPTLGQARAQTWKVHGQYVQSGLYPNTELGITASEVGNDANAGQQGFYVGQEFVTANKLHLSRQSAAYRQQAADFEVAVQQHRVRNDVRSAFYDVLTQARLLELADVLVEVAARGEKLTQIRLQQLEGSRIDVLQAQTELQRANVMKQNIQAEFDAAWRRLATAVGQQGMPVSQLDGQLEGDVPVLEWDSTLSSLLSSSPQVAQAQMLMGSAQWAWQRANAEPRPNILTQASVQQDFATEYTVFGFQVGVSVPNHNQNQGNIQTAQMEWIRACKDIERIRLSLTRHLAEQFKAYEINRRRAEAFRDEILPTSLETLKLSRSTFEAGELNYVQLLTAQRTYAQANIDYIRALGDLWQSVISIEGYLLQDGLQSPTDFTAE